MDDLEIFNRALKQLGGGVLQTFDEETALGETAALVYRTTIDGLLAEHPWIFNRRTVRLETVSMTLDSDGLLPNGWTKAFRLPAERLGPAMRILTNPRQHDLPLKQFSAEEDLIYCDEDQIWALIQLRAAPDTWPAMFVSAAVACLAAELVMPVSGNSGILKDKQAAAWGSPAENRMGGLLGRAKQVNDSANPSPVISGSDPLTAARF